MKLSVLHRAAQLKRDRDNLKSDLAIMLSPGWTASPVATLASLMALRSLQMIAVPRQVILAAIQDALVDIEARINETGVQIDE